LAFFSEVLTKYLCELRLWRTAFRHLTEDEDDDDDEFELLKDID
jgi:hypothetical protein